METSREKSGQRGFGSFEMKNFFWQSPRHAQTTHNCTFGSTIINPSKGGVVLVYKVLYQIGQAFFLDFRICFRTFLDLGLSS